LKAVIVDIDDTLLDTSERMQGIWRHVLDVDVPIPDILEHSLEELFMKYASTEQKSRMRDLQKLFFSLMLCENETGMALAQLDKPMHGAVEVLHGWMQRYKIIYLTGRPDNTRDVTAKTLKKYGYPVDDVKLEMVTLQDWKNRIQIQAREQLLESLVNEYEVEMVIDDFPGYFTKYRDSGIPTRIGYRAKKHSISDYTSKGATRVVESWDELRDI
jgi:phosphoglycolate phosphatase-like HAD superfamily hydrolase